MADVDINKFRASVVRDGSKPSSPGFIVSEGQDPVNPPGTNNYVPYSGATANVELGEFGVEAGFITLDTTPTNTPTDQGTIFWDADDETVDIVLNGYTMKIGEDLFYPVKNQTGSTIAKGVAVRFNGTLGASGRLLIAPFIADGSVPSSRFMGVTAEEILNGEDGKVLYFGRVRGINTSAFSEGDILYASTTVAGGYQTAIPVAPNNIVQVAAVISSHASNGTIFVRPTLGSNINKDEGVKIVSVADKNLLQYQIGTSLWENKSLAQVLGGTSAQFVKGDGSLDSTSYGTGTVTSVGLSSATSGVTIGSTPVTTSGTITLAIATASGSQNGLLSSTDWTTFNNKANSVAGGYLPLSGGTMTGVITTPNGTFGIIVGDDSRLADRNTANTLFVEGVQDTDRGYINFSQTSGNALGAINAGDLTWRGNAVVTGTGTSGQVAFWNGTNTQTGSNNLFWDNANARLGIGTNLPTRALTINRTNEFAALNIVKNNTGNQIVYLGTGSSGVDDLGLLHLSDLGTVKVQIYSGGVSYFNGGNLLVGTTTDSGGRFQVLGTGVGNTTARFGDGLVRFGATDNGANQIVSIAPGVFGIDAPGIGNGRFIVNGSGNVAINSATDGGYGFFVKDKTSGFIFNGRAQGSSIWQADNNANNSIVVYSVSQDNYNTAGTTIILGRNSSTSRSINAGGTINASGADYAEYMTKAIEDNIAKGDIVGIDKNGLLTNIFADSISFVVKSTDPSYVGGDTWGNVDIIGKLPNDATDEQKAEHEAKIEAAREKVDRIAFSGQVPCNVFNSKVGDYIIPINVDGKIKGQAVTNPSFEQYQISVGKVWKIMEDGRAWIAVKIG